MLVKGTPDVFFIWREKSPEHGNFDKRPVNLTHWGLNKIGYSLKKAFWNTVCENKLVAFRLGFHWTSGNGVLVLTRWWAITWTDADYECWPIWCHQATRSQGVGEWPHATVLCGCDVFTYTMMFWSISVIGRDKQQVRSGPQLRTVTIKRIRRQPKSRKFFLN